MRVNATDANGDSAVMLAARNGHEHVASFLRKEYTGGRRGHHHDRSSSGVARWAIEVSLSKFGVWTRMCLALHGSTEPASEISLPPLCCSACVFQSCALQSAAAQPPQMFRGELPRSISWLIFICVHALLHVRPYFLPIHLTDNPPH